jgi:hypothetical protein
LKQNILESRFSKNCLVELDSGSRNLQNYPRDWKLKSLVDLEVLPEAQVELAKQSMIHTWVDQLQIYSALGEFPGC